MTTLKTNKNIEIIYFNELEEITPPYLTLYKLLMTMRVWQCEHTHIHTYVVYLLLYALPAVVQNYAEKVSVSLLLLSQAFSLFPALPLPLYHKHKHTICMTACVHKYTYFYFDFADRVNIDYTNVLEIKQ